MKGQKALANQLQQQQQQQYNQYQTAYKAAETPSPAETQREGERKAYFDWKAAGDYRKPPPSLINLALSDPAAARARREMEASAVGTGVFGLGGAEANPTAIGLAKENLADTNEREQAANYEGQVRAEDAYQRTDNSSVLMAQDWARKMGLVSSSQGMTGMFTNARLQAQPQSILPMIFSAAAGGAGALLGNPALFAGAGSGGSGGGTHGWF